MHDDKTLSKEIKQPSGCPGKGKEREKTAILPDFKAIFARKKILNFFCKNLVKILDNNAGLW